MKKKIAKEEEEEEQEDEDRISPLPDAILHSILSLLTLKESCATIVLSKRWLPLFPSLPNLIFDSDDSPWDPEDTDVESWLSATAAVLNSRTAPLKSCTVASRFFKPYAADFITIIRFLLNNAGVEQLSLHNSGFKLFPLPSFLFSSPSLTALDLRGCALAVPSAFAGLGRLRSLSIHGCVLGDDDVSRILSQCSSIERLKLEYCYKVKNLVICGTKIRSLYLCTHRPMAVKVAETTGLEEVTVKFCYDCAFMHHRAFEEEEEEEEDGDRDDVDWINDDDDGDDDDAGGESEIGRLLGLLRGLGGVQRLALEFESRYMQVIEELKMPAF